ncbi:hypothetical protein LzC2_12800 [Planctomycetes bacterium LzC2]|uniref:Uncharacterized protein n=1 Tax=Alienimonas chondri TaxID=2681879 RepID=A0ABX1VAU2_9PLAN|nr:hypothetical protein [Alienimonas chondri]
MAAWFVGVLVRTPDQSGVCWRRCEPEAQEIFARRDATFDLLGTSVVRCDGSPKREPRPGEAVNVEQLRLAPQAANASCKKLLRFGLTEGRRTDPPGALIARSTRSAPVSACPPRVNCGGRIRVFVDRPCGCRPSFLARFGLSPWGKRQPRRTRAPDVLGRLRSNPRGVANKNSPPPRGRGAATSGCATGESRLRTRSRLRRRPGCPGRPRCRRGSCPNEPSERSGCRHRWSR